MEQSKGLKISQAKENESHSARKIMVEKTVRLILAKKPSNRESSNGGLETILEPIGYESSEMSDVSFNKYKNNQQSDKDKGYSYLMESDS